VLTLPVDVGQYLVIIKNIFSNKDFNIYKIFYSKFNEKIVFKKPMLE